LLLERTLFEKRDKIAIAIERLKEFEPTEGYYVAFSGGKDSIVIAELAKMAEVEFELHYNLTTVDPPELVNFIKKEYPETIIEKPERTMWELIVKHRIPPTRIIRYCCEELKERGGGGRTVVTGIRWQESYKRSKRKMVENCYKDNGKWFVHPIIDWKNEDVWEFIKLKNLRYCKLYDEGYKRLGCIMCPMKGRAGMLRDAERWPKIKAAYIRAFDRCVTKRLEDGLEIKYKNSLEMYKWWVGKKIQRNEKQFEFPL